MSSSEAMSSNPTTISRSAIVAEVHRILTAELNVDVPSHSEDLIDTGLLDSLTFVELLFLIEQNLGYSIDIESLELDDLRTVERIADTVEKGLSGPSA